MMHMNKNYNRAERYDLKFEDYLREYDLRYPDGGPNHSSDCGEGSANCGCWVCRSIAWNLHKKPCTESCDVNYEEGSIFRPVVKILLIVWVIVTINGYLNEEYHAKTGGMYRLENTSLEKHWLYK